MSKLQSKDFFSVRLPAIPIGLKKEIFSEQDGMADHRSFSEILNTIILAEVVVNRNMLSFPKNIHT